MSTFDDRLDALAGSSPPCRGCSWRSPVGRLGVVLAAAVRALGPGGWSPPPPCPRALPASERARAAEFAASLGVGGSSRAPTSCPGRATGRTPATGALLQVRVVDVLTPLAGPLGMAHVVTGTNADDVVAGFRPGIRAAAERGA